MHQYPQPLRQSGVLKEYDQFELTPIVGTEFQNVDLAEWLAAPNSDDLIRDLAIMIAERGVVFFRKQENLTNERHKELINQLGALGGRPKDNGLYVHPLWQIREEADPELQLLNPEGVIKIYGKTATGEKKQSGVTEWHTDISFEQNPPDYSSLRLTDLPPGGGGDTLWASAYEVYDKLSTPYQKFFESLTATYSQDALNKVAQAKGTTIFMGPRGSPSNVGSDLASVHPVVRTHPITGWKAVFALGVHCSHINDVTKSESNQILKKIVNLAALNPDLQVRFHWQNPHDIAIWDNRAVYHAPIQNHIGKRRGWRVLSVGEKPYLDPNSVSRAEYLAGLTTKENENTGAVDHQPGEGISNGKENGHRCTNGNGFNLATVSGVAVE